MPHLLAALHIPYESVLLVSSKADAVSPYDEVQAYPPGNNRKDMLLLACIPDHAQS